MIQMMAVYQWLAQSASPRWANDFLGYLYPGRAIVLYLTCLSVQIMYVKILVNNNFRGKMSTFNIYYTT